MTIYADAVFALNSAINYLMLLSSARLSGRPFRHARLLLSAALGGVYAAAALLPELPFLQCAGFRLLMPLVMVLCAFGAQRGTLRQAAAFFAVSAALAGCVIVLMQLCGKQLILLPSGAYYPVSASAVLLTASLVALLCRIVLYCAAQRQARVEPLTVRLRGRQETLNALYDTGNTLRDPISNRSVIVAQWQLAGRLLPELRLKKAEFEDPAGLMQRLAGQKEALCLRLIPYRAVGCDSGLLLAIRCEVTERGKTHARLVAFSPTPVCSTGQFEALTGGTP